MIECLYVLNKSNINYSGDDEDTSHVSLPPQHTCVSFIYV